MNLQFLGAAQTVTGSRYLLSSGEDHVLIDCGLFQGYKELRLRNWAPFPVEPEKIKAVVLTHAHLDHCGYIPLLVKNGFRGPIYATAPTRELAKILLLDSGHLQEEEARYANKKGYSKHHPALPLYTRDDADAAMASFVDIPWHQTMRINNLEVMLFPAGHLLGAASVRLNGFGKSILFSGDLGRFNDPLIKAPENPPNADLLVVESTYGDRTHPQVNSLDELKEVIVRTLDRKGIVLIPSFAVGRAQAILYYLNELKKKGLIPDVPVYLNSPMANLVNQVFCKYAGEHKLSPQAAAEVCDSAQVISTAEESIALNLDKKPKIIIAASGMATGGRVLHHLKSLAPDPRNSIVFCGFQAGGTRGEVIVHGAREVKIHGEMWAIEAEVFNMGSLSSHGDGDEVLDWIRRMHKPPAHVFITHGEPSAAEAFGQRLKRELAIASSVPAYRDIVEL